MRSTQGPAKLSDVAGRLHVGAFLRRAAGRQFKLIFLLPLLFLSPHIFSPPDAAFAQRGLAESTSERHVLYGDFKIDGADGADGAPASFDIILYTSSGNVISRQRVTNNGRYRFLDIHNGVYDLVVETESQEVARMRLVLNYLSKTDVRQDIHLEWRADPAAKKEATAAVVHTYPRTPENEARFEQAQKAIRNKDTAQAITLLRQIVAEDDKDYPAWTDLGTLYFKRNEAGAAEKAFTRALQERPSYFLAALNLGVLRVSQKNFQAAVEPLTSAVAAQPHSAEANYFLGEAYLGIKKGSKAVGYLNEAIRLDPVGRAGAHLRLATLYHLVGMKDKAAAEYEQYLAKKPDHPERKKLEQYIKENRKQ